MYYIDKHGLFFSLVHKMILIMILLYMQADGDSINIWYFQIVISYGSTYIYTKLKSFIFM